MAELDFDSDLEDNIDCDCDLEEQDCDPGCMFRLKVGPCSALNRRTGELNMDLMCTPPTTTAHTPNFIRPLIERPFRNSCRIQRSRGTPDCNFDVDFVTCQLGASMKYLLSDCPIAVCMTPRIDLYDPTLPASQQTILMLRGLFIGSDWSLTNDLIGDQATSRNFSCTGKVWGVAQWLNSLPSAEELLARKSA
jgi:hypothetical protein